MKACWLLSLLCCAANILAADRSSAPEPAPNPGTALITGSDRGLGLALAREFERRGWRVIATCRDPAKAMELAKLSHDHSTVTIEKLDVNDGAAIEALAVKLKGHPIDALVNNAGITGSIAGQSLGRLDPDAFDRVLRVNSLAPLRVSAAFVELVAASKQRKIIGMSSGYGSLSSIEGLAGSGYPNAYFYAMSKAALNMGLREFAFEEASRGIITVLLSPGAVDTDMQRDVRDEMARSGKPITSPVLTPEDSAHTMVVTIEQLKPEDNGKFLSRKGNEIPW